MLVDPALEWKAVLQRMNGGVDEAREPEPNNVALVLMLALILQTGGFLTENPGAVLDGRVQWPRVLWYM